MKELPLYQWQKEALAVWKQTQDPPDADDPASGNWRPDMTVAAVTGSGKTELAKRIMSKWLEDMSGFHSMVSIIVPRKALMTQWREELITSGWTADEIGRVGGGSIKGWKVGTKPQINILTINAMRDGKMSDFLNDGFSGIHRNHLVIVDECHNLRGERNRLALSHENCPREAVLGLSATPHPTEEARRVVEELCGPIRYSYRYGQALADGVIPPFILHAVQIPLSPEEHREHTVITQKIKNLMRDADKEWGPDKNRLIQIAKNLGMQRKRLLNRCRSRFHLALRILNQHGADTPTLLFHDSIEDVERLATMAGHFDPAIYHSQSADGNRELERFKNEETNHLFSCLALTEGFNVPRVELAVMMSGPNAPLRRIQTLGRCLRGKADKPNEIYFLYVQGTKDEVGLHNLLREGDIPEVIQVKGDEIQVVRHWRMTDTWMESIAAPTPPHVFVANHREQMPSIHDPLTPEEEQSMLDFLRGFN